MEILVIGNGFDLAHQLPTKYTDFLEFIKVMKQIVQGVNVKEIVWGKLCFSTQAELQGILSTEPKYFMKEIAPYWNERIKDNIWLEYFEKSYDKENWVDFEREISNVIKSIDNDMRLNENENESLDSIMPKSSNEYLANYYAEYFPAVQYIELKPLNISYKEIRNRLIKDLNNLIISLKFYLEDYVLTMEIPVSSPDISKINPDKILSFNYTDTYQRVYGNKKDIKYDYIHGEVKSGKTKTNLVIGIDEYLNNDRKNKDIEFIVFKKYYQRIQKETGCLYLDWVEQIKSEYDSYLLKHNEAIRRTYDYSDGSIQGSIRRDAASYALDKDLPKHNVYIFGHSIDITDKDILKSLILNDNVNTTIFYLNDAVHEQQIANLVLVIGQDELIRRTGGPNKTITFKKQSTMMKKE